MMQLSPACEAAWQKFLSSSGECAHAARPVVGGSIGDHVAACLESARSAARRVKNHVGALKVERVLDVGSSTGVLSLALSEVFDGAEIVGIEPELGAVEAARALVQDHSGHRISFCQAAGEQMPFPSESFSLVVCHTVIEHVRDVPQVIGEIQRVLFPGGKLHLEAPNYRWPFEPHLHVWCLPFLGHWSIKLAAIIQGAYGKREFVDHLQLVTPHVLEAIFHKMSLAYENRALDKARAVLRGDHSSIVAHPVLARYLESWGRSLGPDRLLQWIDSIGVYPRLVYVAEKK